jgi:hypothetical protein
VLPGLITATTSNGKLGVSFDLVCTTVLSPPLANNPATASEPSSTHYGQAQGSGDAPTQCSRLGAKSAGEGWGFETPPIPLEKKGKSPFAIGLETAQPGRGPREEVELPKEGRRGLAQTQGVS